MVQHVLMTTCVKKPLFRPWKAYFPLYFTCVKRPHNFSGKFDCKSAPDDMWVIDVSVITLCGEIHVKFTLW